MIPQNLLKTFDPLTGEIPGSSATKRYLSDLRGCFADADAYEDALAKDNPLLYSVAGIEPANGQGDLHYGVGCLMPGRVGAEYYMTKGHLHSWREAAEIYIGLSGEGAMLLEDEHSGESQLVPLQPHGVVYVPGGTMHRTINTGKMPLIYIGVYPAKAGHDYGCIAARNFREVVIARNDKPILIERNNFCDRICN
jgi:glucose-6-phosphate isomerase, archaeal